METENFFIYGFLNAENFFISGFFQKTEDNLWQGFMNSKENSWRAEARYNENCLLINIFSQGHLVFSKITLRNKAGNVFEGSYESLSNRKMIAQVVYVSSDMMSFLLSEKG